MYIISFARGGGEILSTPTPSWTKDNYAFLISYADGNKKKTLAYFIVYESIVSAWVKFGGVTKLIWAGESG